MNTKAGRDEEHANVRRFTGEGVLGRIVRRHDDVRDWFEVYEKMVVVDENAKVRKPPLNTSRLQIFRSSLLRG